MTRPDLGQHPQPRRLVETVVHGDEHENVIGRVLGIFHRHIEVAVVLEDPGVEDLVLGIRQTTPGVFRHQIGIGKGRLGVLVEHAHIGMTGHAVEVEIQLLDVFAMIAFGVVQAEQALLENAVVFIPQRQPQAPVLGLVGEPGQAVLAPAIGTAAGMFVGEVAPGIAIGAVVLAHRAPLSFTQVRPPLAPVLALTALQAPALNRIENAGGGFCRHRGVSLTMEVTCSVGVARLAAP